MEQEEIKRRGLQQAIEIKRKKERDKTAEVIRKE
jgi:hypothetical protein